MLCRFSATGQFSTAACLVGLAVPGLQATPSRVPEAPFTVALVNGQPITERMFKHMLRRFRAEVIGEFSPPALDSAFWDTPVRGRTPRDVLKKRALAECIRIGVQLQMASREGLLEHPEFDAIMAELPIENQRRREAQRGGQVIYGPTQFTEDTYFSYRFSNLLIRLKERLGAQELAPSRQDLKRAYEREITSRHRPDAIVVQRIFVPALPSKEAARLRAQELQKSLGTGAHFDALALANNPADIPLELSLGASKGRKGSDPILVREAGRLQPGQISRTFEAEGGFNILKCTSRKPFSQRSPEEVLPILRRKLIDQAYEALVDRQIRGARVRKNPKSWDSLGVE